MNSVRLQFQRFFAFVLLLSWFSIQTGCSKNSASNLSLKDLEGRWQVVHLAKGGQERTRRECLAAKMILDFKEGTCTCTADGRLIVKGKLTLEGEKNPAQTMQQIEEGEDKGKTQLGIIRIENGVLEWCMAQPGEDRPKEFASPSGSKDEVARLERVTK